ncbi:MAG: SPOR domain-containing protein [Deltaproteobacteria bacterium]|nr:SPOR domain-containing protein [Deltaproteobacteria bacterium]
MAKKRENRLEAILRYEIILALFALIGLYYFLSFSPVRLPAKPVSSPPQPLRLQSAAPATSHRAAANAQADQPAGGDTQPPQAATKPAGKAAPGPQPTPTGAATAPTATGSDQSDKPATPPAAAKAAAADSAPAAGEQPGGPPTATEAGKTTPVPAAAKKPAAEPKREIPAGKQTPAAAPKSGSRPAGAAAKPPAGEKTAAAVSSLPATATETAAGGKKAGTPAVKTPASAAPQHHHHLADGGYVIQAGTFIFRDSLRHCRRLLSANGYASFVVTRRQEEPMHRVFLGPYPDRRAAVLVRNRVRGLGDEPFICRRPKGYYVNVGSFYYRSKAAERVARYRRLGYAPRVFREPVKIRHYILLVNGFRFHHYPKDALNKIHQLGIPDAFVRPWHP